MRRPGWTILITTLVTLVVPRSAHAVTDGELAQTCAFPAVVRLESSRSDQACTGSYIGGRALITAAHCFDNRGYQLDPLVVFEALGTQPDFCEADADCPAVSIAGELQPLSCQQQAFEGFPADAGVCYLPALEYSNDLLIARFGEAYEEWGVEHPGVSVPIRYCHINPAYLADPSDTAADFAYCVLSEAPDVQAVPIMMACEVDQFMSGKLDLDVLIAGFGVAGPEQGTHADKPGRKRWASASTNFTIHASSDPLIGLAPFSDFVPGAAASGDSGGPVYVRLPAPHGTWRVLGVLVKPLFATTPWQFVDWMLADPELEGAAIVPCFDDGEWKPSAACGGFPTTLSEGAGAWARGPVACGREDLGGLSQTCGAPYPSPLPEQAPGLAPPPAAAGTSSANSVVSCSVTDHPSTGQLALVLLGLGLCRRRRRLAAASVLSLAVVSGCGELSEASDGGGTGTSGGDQEPQPIPFNPTLHGVHSGITLPGVRYDQLAVGNVARAVDDASCCQDIVLGGPSSPRVEVRFGGGSVDHGLTFLAPRPAHQYELASPGHGVRELALVDLDDDGYNDLVGVTTEGQLAVRRGKSGGVDDAYFRELTQFEAAPGINPQLGAIAIGHVDCDDDLDVVIAAPGERGVVTLMQTGPAEFGAAQFAATAPVEGEEAVGRARAVAIGDFDGEGAAELVSGNGDGTLTIYRREKCDGEFVADASVVFHHNVDNCEEAPDYCVSDTNDVFIATDDVYCDTPRSDLILAYAERIRTYCNDGSLAEKIEQDQWSVRWDLNDHGKASLSRMSAVAWWPDSEALYAISSKSLFRLAPPGTSLYASTVPIMTHIKSPAQISECNLHRHIASQQPIWWQRLVWLGSVEGHSYLRFMR